MPRPSVFEPKSLESLCVQNVAENLGKVEWYQTFVGDECDPTYWLSNLDVLRKEADRWSCLFYDTYEYFL